jgi:hypothetical protein
MCMHKGSESQQLLTTSLIRQVSILTPSTLIDSEGESTTNVPQVRHSAAVHVVRFSPTGSCQLHIIVLVSNLVL